MRLTNTTKYDDIIHLPHHVSKHHSQMPIEDRAAQFSPFAALTGHGAAIKETERLTDRRIELDENYKSIMNAKLQMIMEKIAAKPMVHIMYFCPDKQKEGGEYREVCGRIKRIDECERQLILTDGQKIELEQIVGVEEVE